MEENTVPCSILQTRRLRFEGRVGFPKVLELLGARARFLNTCLPPVASRDLGERHTDSDIGRSTLLASRGKGGSFLVARMWMSKAQLPTHT